MNRFLPALVTALAVHAGLPPGVAAQSPLDLLRSVRQGGAWISIPVTAGEGRLTTDTLPTLGVRFDGCLTVWGGHSGAWTLDARDPVNGERLDAVALPGRGVPFTYQTGPRSQVDVRVRWTEARDTVLLVWVGLHRENSERDPCTPVYGGGGEAAAPAPPPASSTSPPPWRAPRRGSAVLSSCPACRRSR